MANEPSPTTVIRTPALSLDRRGNALLGGLTEEELKALAEALEYCSGSSAVFSGGNSTRAWAYKVAYQIQLHLRETAQDRTIKRLLDAAQAGIVDRPADLVGVVEGLSDRVIFTPHGSDIEYWVSVQAERKQP